MHRKVIIAATTVLVLTFTVVAVGLRPLSAPEGPFGPTFSAAERKDIVSSARRCAIQQSLRALRKREFRLAWHRIVDARMQTVRGVWYNNERSLILVKFGIDDSNAAGGYAVSATYWMTKTNGHWVPKQF